MPSSYDLRFHKKVRKENYSQLEQLFFFNENQYRYYDRIMELVEKYGEPYIEKNSDFITIKLEKIETVSLFASIGPKLVGTLIYREDPISRNLSIIHISTIDLNSKKKFDSSKILYGMLDALSEEKTDFNNFKILYTNTILNITKIK